MDMIALRRRGGAWDRALPDWDGPLLGYCFGAQAYRDDPEPFEDLARRYPGLTLVGCSSAGEILGDEVRDGTLAVALVRFARTGFRAAALPVASADDSAAVGAALAAELAGPGLRAVTVFSDGLRVNGTDLARGMVGALPDGVLVSGGLAADGDRFASTWVLVEGRPVEGWITAVGLYGDDVVVRHGSAGGWRPFGPVRKVTRSAGAVLHELDDRPALALYKEYLGERANGLPATALLFPLQVGTDDGRSVVRTVLGVDEASQSMTFAGDITEGATAQLMRASFEGLVDGAEDAAAQAVAAAPALCLAVSCVGRRLVMGEAVEEEVEATASALPPGSLQVGFYSYGELAPTGFTACDLHNQTMTLTTVTEGPA